MRYFIQNIFILALLIPGVDAFCQVKADIKEFDFGTLQNWSETPAVFTLTNNSNEPMAILNIRKSLNVHVNYPRQFIKPGATARIFVYFEPPDIGKFNEDILVYTSNTRKPVQLIIKGKVNSFQECPSAIATGNTGNLSFELSGMVISGQTHKPVPGAVVRLVNAQDFKTLKIKTGKDGKFDKTIPTGLYIVQVEVPGYRPYEQNQYLNKNSPFFEISLTEDADNATEWVANDDPEKEINEISRPEKKEAKPFYQSGTVIDKSSGQPVGRASVVLKSLKTNTPYFYKTMNDGKFRKLLMPGDYKLKVFADGFESFEKTIRLSSPDSILAVELTKAETGTLPAKKEISKPKVSVGPVKVAGTIIKTENGFPVARASVTFKNKETGTPYFYKTFKDGKFNKTLPAGKYELHVEAAGLTLFDTVMTITNTMEGLKIFLSNENSPAEDAKKPLAARTKIKVMAFDKESGLPLENVNINLYNVMRDKLYMFKTNNKGIGINTADTGRYAISLKAPGYKTYFGNVIIYPGNELPSFQLEKLQSEIVPVEKHGVKDSTKTVLNKVDKARIENLETKPARVDKEILSPSIYLANNLVFLVDVSSSMNHYHKIDNLKYAMNRLVNILRDIDMVTLITYSARPSIIFSAMPANRKDSIRKMIDSMNPEGLTYGIRGLEKAYSIAEDNFIPGGNNEVIIATDGEFNSPDYSEIQMVNMVTRYALKDIKLTVIGFGKNEKALRTLKRMSVFGKGNFLHIQNRAEAESILIEEIKLNSQIR